MECKDLYSYKDLETLTNKSYKQLKRLSFILQIFPRQVGRKSYFNEEELQQILNYRPKKRISKDSRKKITVIEEYLRLGSARKVATRLTIKRDTVNKIVKEWRENDEYITVDSSINYTPSSPFKNIRTYGGKWVYGFIRNGIRYYKGGFKTEEEAFDALCVLKESLKNE